LVLVFMGDWGYVWY